MATELGRVFSGARAEIHIKGSQGLERVGYATGVPGTETLTLQEVEVLGHIDPIEIEPIGRRVTVTADFVRFVGMSLRSKGLWPKAGADANSAVAEVVNFPDLEFIVFDAISGQKIFKVEGIKCETRTFRVDRAGLTTTNATFRGLRMTDEGDASNE